jgi:hypothetical protein
LKIKEGKMTKNLNDLPDNIFFGNMDQINDALNASEKIDNQPKRNLKLISKKKVKLNERTNMLTIDQITQIENVTHSRKIPADISALMSSSYFSQTHNEMRRVGDLSLPQFIRVLRSRKIISEHS